MLGTIQAGDQPWLPRAAAASCISGDGQGSV